MKLKGPLLVCHGPVYILGIRKESALKIFAKTAKPRWIVPVDDAPHVPQIKWNMIEALREMITTFVAALLE